MLFQSTSEASPQKIAAQTSTIIRDDEGASQSPTGVLHNFKHDHQSRDQELMEAELTVENYQQRFHQLLCREEDEHERLMKER